MESTPPHRRLIKRVAPFLWDVACVASVVGIWPRYIEPNLLKVSNLSFPVRDLPESLNGLRFVQFSDLHIHPGVPDRFLRRLADKLQALKPDLLLFTGDFLCYSKMRDQERLLHFLQQLHARHGCYAIFGNHDYNYYVGINGEGNYDILDRVQTEVVRGVARVVCGHTLRFERSPRLSEVAPQHQLLELLQKTPFELLENQTRQIPVGSTSLNICGLGEYMAGRFQPEKAFASYDPRFPGLILAHNPDCVKYLQKFPGDVILCGHVHGGQVNLPWVRDRLVLLEDKTYVRGTYPLGNRWVHVNRGVGGTFRFRLFSIPEITHGVLRRK